VFCEHSVVQSVDAMSTIPHTNIIVKFRRIIFVNKEYIFVDRQQANLLVIQSSNETTFLQLVYTQLKLNAYI